MEVHIELNNGHNITIITDKIGAEEMRDALGDMEAIIFAPQKDTDQIAVIPIRNVMYLTYDKIEESGERNGTQNNDQD